MDSTRISCWSDRIPASASSKVCEGAVHPSGIGPVTPAGSEGDPAGLLSR